MPARARATSDEASATLWTIEELARRGAPASALAGLLGDASADASATRGKLGAYFHLARARTLATSAEDGDAEEARWALEACARAIRCDEDGTVFARDGRERRAYEAVCERLLVTNANAATAKDRANMEWASALRRELLPGSASPLRVKGAAKWTLKDAKDLSEMVAGLLAEWRSKTTSLMVVQENMATTYYQPTRAPPATPTRPHGKENVQEPPREWVDVGKRAKKAAPKKAAPKVAKKASPNAAPKSATPTKTPEVVSPAQRGLLGRVSSLIARSPAPASTIKSPAPTVRSPTPAKAPVAAKEPEYASPTRRLLGNVVSFVARSLSLSRKSLDPAPAATNTASPKRDSASPAREREPSPEPEMPEDDFDDIMPTQIAPATKRKEVEEEEERPTKKGRVQPEKTVEAEQTVKRGPGRPKKRSNFHQSDGESDGDYEQVNVVPTQEAPPSPPRPRGRPKKQRTAEPAPKSKATIEPAAQPLKKRYSIDNELAQRDDVEEAPTAPASPAAAAGSPRISAPSPVVARTPVAAAAAPVVPRAPRVANTRRRVTRFTEIEERALREGVREYGKGAWAQILLAKHAVFSQNKRTQVDLKDKWRNIEMKDKRAREALDRDALTAA